MIVVAAYLDAHPWQKQVDDEVNEVELDYHRILADWEPTVDSFDDVVVVVAVEYHYIHTVDGTCLNNTSAADFAANEEVHPWKA